MKGASAPESSSDGTWKGPVRPVPADPVPGLDVTRATTGEEDLGALPKDLGGPGKASLPRNGWGARLPPVDCQPSWPAL